MTDSAEFPYRLAVGWITKAALEANDAYLLTNFPAQSDQASIFINPWGPPDDFSTFPAFTRYGQYAITTQWSDGPVTFTWDLAYFTEIMVAYFEGLVWGGLGMYPDAVTQSVAVTQKTRKHNGEFGVYQGYLNRPIPNQGFKRGFRGVDNYRATHVGGTEIFA